MPPGPIAVVGASLGGLNAAEALLESSEVTAVTLIDAERRAPYDRPPLSKELLLGKLEPERCTLAELDDARLTRRGGVRVTGLDSDRLALTFADGSTERFDGGIVIATGTVPRTLPGSRIPGVHVLRTLDDALSLRADISGRQSSHVVIAGGGFIGTEVAAACSLRGHQVTILEAQSEPFERTLGVEVGTALLAPLLACGVRLLTRAAVASVSGTDRVKAVTLEDGTIRSSRREPATSSASMRSRRWPSSSPESTPRSSPESQPRRKAICALAALTTANRKPAGQRRQRQAVFRGRWVSGGFTTSGVSGFTLDDLDLVAELLLVACARTRVDRPAEFALPCPRRSMACSRGVSKKLPDPDILHEHCIVRFSVGPAQSLA